MQHCKTYLAFLFLSLCAGMQISCQNDESEDIDQVTMVNVGDGVPEFNLKAIDGQVVSSSSLSGQVYVLNFFDTGCGDCQKELPVLQQIYEKYGESVPVLNVPRSQSQAEVQAYWNETGLTMPFYIPTDKGLYYKFAARGIPRAYVIDGNGKVQAMFTDSPLPDYNKFEESLQMLLPESRTDYVNLSLRFVTRASDGDDNSFHNEFAVSDVCIYFFDAETKEYFTSFCTKSFQQENDLNNSNYDITYLSENLPIPAGVYDIFAIANYQDYPSEITTEQDLLSIIDTETYKEGIEASMPLGGPVMTSRPASLLGVDIRRYVGKTYVLRIELERVLAKIQVGVKQNVFSLVHDSETYAEINITNYKFVNLNAHYYLFQHRDSFLVFNGQPNFSFPKNYTNYSDEGEQYVVDPYFYQKTPDIVNEALFADKYKSWYGDFTTTDFASMPPVGKYGYAYILENTSYKASQKNGYSPGIVFKAAVNPEIVYIYDKELKKFSGERRPENWPLAIYLYNYKFYGTIAAINYDNELSIPESLGRKDVSDNELKAYGIKKSEFNMGVYETYYTYWIRHRDSDDPMGPMRYGVVRNNYYQLAIKGVTGLGNSKIDPDVMRDNHPNSYVDVLINN